MCVCGGGGGGGGGGGAYIQWPNCKWQVLHFPAGLLICKASPLFKHHLSPLLPENSKQPLLEHQIFNPEILGSSPVLISNRACFTADQSPTVKHFEVPTNVFFDNLFIV